VRRKSSDLGSNPPSGHLRLTVLLATVAAFFVVSVGVAQASEGVEHLKVNITGTGSGTVKSGPNAFSVPGEGYWGTAPYIECKGPPTAPIGPGSCETVMSEPAGEGFEQVYLFAEAAPGSEFVEWTVQHGETEACLKFESGPNVGKGVCTPYVEPSGTGEDNSEVTAVFAAEPGLPLKVTHEGTGGGTIQSSPAGITCTTGECQHGYAEGTEVTLTASPAPGSAFVAWKNCDTGGVHGRQCTVHVTPGHKVVGAKFEPANTVTVKTKGNGTGSVSGVTCGNTCTEASGIFLASKAVTLKAKPYTKTSEFKGWTASPVSCTTPEPTTCSLGLLGANETVEAEFAEMARENLTVTKTGNGQGAVKSAPAGISCSYTCGTNTAYYYKGASVTLTASIQEGKGSTLGNWGGACSGTAATPCTVTMSEAKSVTVGFN
jgi:hypothetical protein